MDRLEGVRIYGFFNGTFVYETVLVLFVVAKAT
jgi:hypothetical protein